MNYNIKRYNEGGFLDFFKKGYDGASKGLHSFNNTLKESPGLYSGITAVSQGLSNGSKPKVNQEFASFSSDFRKGNDMQSGLDNALDLGSTAANFIPGVGQAVSAGLQAVKAITNLTSADEDEYGIHKSGFMSALDPQSERRKQKTIFENNKLQEARNSADEVGAQSRAAIGGFQSTPYGRKGMKLKTRFSK